MGVTYAEIVERASQLPDPIAVGGSRLVVHIQTSPDAVDDLLTIIRELSEEKKASGFIPPKTAPHVNGNGNIYKDVFVRKV